MYTVKPEFVGSVGRSNRPTNDTNAIHFTIANGHNLLIYLAGKGHRFRRPKNKIKIKFSVQFIFFIGEKVPVTGGSAKLYRYIFIMIKKSNSS